MESKCRWRVFASGALMVGMLAVTVHGQDFARRVAKADGGVTTVFTVNAGDGSVTVASGGGTPMALLYDTGDTGYIAGCWGGTCGGFPCGAWGDQLILDNFPPAGGDIAQYTYGYAAGYGSHGFRDCTTECDCLAAGSVYRMESELYDAAPAPGCGAGIPIPGTYATFTTDRSRVYTGDYAMLVNVALDPKVIVPREVWMAVRFFDTGDIWMEIGGIPSPGSGPMIADWIDSGTDGIGDEWECADCPACYGAPLDWARMQVVGNAGITFSMVPVPPPAGTKHPGTYTIDKNGLTLDKGDEVVFFEIRVTSFDPEDAGVLLKAWQAGIDAAAGYASGLQGTLAPHFSDCSVTDECATQMGPGSVCPFPATNCPAGFIEKGRSDYIFVGQMELNAVDVSTLNYRYASTLMGAPMANWAADYYLATLVLHVPMDAKGTFTIPFLLAPDTALVDSNNQFIPLIGMVPGTVTVTTGRCCFGLGADDKKGGCIEDVTANQCENAGLCKGYCDLDDTILCLSDYDCEQQGAPAGSICMAGATLGNDCFTVLEKPDGKPLGCDGPDVCIIQGSSLLLTDGLTCDDPCIECLDASMCDDEVACTNDTCVDNFCVFTANDDKCDDGNDCTDDTCDELLDCQFVNDDTNDCDDGAYCNGAEYCDAGQCISPGDPCEDGLGCTADTCYEDTDSCTNVKTDCSDADPCTVDDCNEPNGDCTNVLLPAFGDSSCPIVGTDLDDCLAKTIDQYTGVAVATAWDAASGCCLCILCSNHTACDDLEAIVPACRANLYFDIHGSAKPNPVCFAQGEKIVVDVMTSESLQMIQGAQFVVEYDPACVTFNSISPAANFPFEIEEIVDAANGRVFYAVGVDPFTGGGIFSGAVATMSFTKIGVGCVNCTFDFGGVNPQNTFFVNDEGQLICADGMESDEIHVNDMLSLVVADDQKVNVDCDASTAMVSFDPPWATSSCVDPDCDPDKDDKCYEVNLDCGGMHESGVDMTALIALGGGEHPQGMTSYWCTATSKICGDSITEEWTVTVNDTVALDVEVQLQPKISGDLNRCITFELFAGCVQKPLEIKQVLTFGGIWDFVGHFTDTKKIPKGQYECITARDRWHTLRAVSDIVCTDGVYHAAFKGDPFFGGNWLVGGNIDTWKKEGENISTDTIDILDFGVFVWQYGVIGDPNTMCPEDKGVDLGAPHADINGDGIVDHLDFTFIMMNFLAASKDSCCPDQGGPAAPVGLTEISVAQLRQMGLGELVVADLNGDGLVNVADMSAFMNGQEPLKKKVRVRDDSGLGSR